MLVGLIGKAGVGKGEAAKLLAREFNLRPAAFADLLKHALVHWGIPLDSVIGSHANKDAPLEAWNDVSGRQYMQALGMAMRHLDPDFWVRAFWATNEKHKHLVIEDVRMPSEVHSIKKRGGLLIKIERPNVAGTVHAQHITETSVDKIQGDVLIINDRSLESFQRNILTAVQRWRDGKISVDRMHRSVHK